MHDTYNFFGNFRLEYKTCGDNTGNHGDGLNDGLTVMEREQKADLDTWGPSITCFINPQTQSRTNHWKSLKYQC